jgi:hypothetical protein
MKRLSGLWVYALVVFIPFLFYGKLFAIDPGERRIFRGDFLNQHYVWKSYAIERAKHGEIPLWSPNVLGGVAFHANPQVGIFYPPTYLLIPFHHDGRVSYLALEAYQLAHQAFAGIGMLVLMRSLGVGNIGALFAALVYLFTGFFTTPGHHAIVLTASWIPWNLYVVRRALLAESPWRWTSLAALTLSLSILAGHPQVAYYGLGATLVWAVVVGGWRKSLRRVLPAAVLAAGIAAVQLLPTYELAAGSDRSELGYDYATSFALSPYSLGALVAPRGQIRLPGQDGSGPLHLYVGVGTWLLASIGLLLSRQRLRVFFSVAAVLALVISFGSFTPLFDWLYAAVPGFGRFRIPVRLLGLYTLAVAVVAGFGLDVLVRADRKTRLRLRSLAKGAFVVFVALGLWAADLQLRLLDAPGALAPAQVERVAGSAYWAALLAALSFLALLLVLWRRNERYWAGAFVAILVVDLGAFVADRGLHPYKTLVRTEERPVHRDLRAQGYRSRYVTESNLESYDMLFGLDFAGGHVSLYNRDYRKLLDLSHRSANALSLLNVKFVVRGAPTSAFPWCGGRFASPLPLLDVPSSMSPARLRFTPSLTVTDLRFYWSPLAAGGEASIVVNGVSHSLPAHDALDVFFDEPTEVEGFEIAVPEGNPGVRLEDIEVDLNPLGLKADFMELEGIKINLHALPRAYFMTPSTVPSERQTFDNLKCWTVHSGVQVSNPKTDDGASGYFRKDAVRIVSYEPESVTLQTRSPRDGFAILSDTYFPGWIADVDGDETAIWKANLVMRAVPVPAGEHLVHLRYRPASYRRGGVITLVSLLVAGGLAVFPVVRRRFISAENEPDEETEGSSSTSA